MSLLIVVPTLGRSDKLPWIADNVRQNTDIKYTLAFVVEASDNESLRMAKLCAQNDSRVVPIINERAASYAGAVNTAFLHTDHDHVFLAADDVFFHPHWDMPLFDRIAADPWAQVIGTNDRLNPYVASGLHATHYLVAREYVDVYGSGVIDSREPILLYEGYKHNYTDTEFIATAKMRSRFRPCLDSIVAHQHHTTGLIYVDDTYEKSMSTMSDDAHTYRSRIPLWMDLVK